MNSVFSVFYQALKYHLKVQSFILSVYQKMFLHLNALFVLVPVRLRLLYEKSQSAPIGQLLQALAAPACVFSALVADSDFILVTSQPY